MVIITLYPNHIKLGEEKIQFILATYTTRVVTNMATLIICFVWFYNVVKHCNRTDFVLNLLLGNTFEIYCIVSIILQPLQKEWTPINYW